MEIGRKVFLGMRRCPSVGDKLNKSCQNPWYAKKNEGSEVFF